MQIQTEAKNNLVNQSLKCLMRTYCYFYCLTLRHCYLFRSCGEFKRVTNGTVTTTIPGSYHSVPQSPVGFVFFTAIEKE